MNIKILIIIGLLMIYSCQNNPPIVNWEGEKENKWLEKETINDSVYLTDKRYYNQNKLQWAKKITTNQEVACVSSFIHYAKGESRSATLTNKEKSCRLFRIERFHPYDNYMLHGKQEEFLYLSELDSSVLRKEKLYTLGNLIYKKHFSLKDGSLEQWIWGDGDSIIFYRPDGKRLSCNGCDGIDITTLYDENGRFIEQKKIPH